MKEILAFCKNTENKYRWDADCEGVPFELYIPQERVPEPLPESIIVRIYNESDYNDSIDQIEELELKMNPELRKKPIIAKLVYNSEKTKTVRYDPINYPASSEIGSPYIPISLLEFPYPKILIIEVEWRN